MRIWIILYISKLKLETSAVNKCTRGFLVTEKMAKNIRNIIFQNDKYLTYNGSD